MHQRRKFKNFKKQTTSTSNLAGFGIVELPVQPGGNGFGAAELRKNARVTDQKFRGAKLCILHSSAAPKAFMSVTAKSSAAPNDVFYTVPQRPRPFRPVHERAQRKLAMDMASSRCAHSLSGLNGLCRCGTV